MLLSGCKYTEWTLIRLKGKCCAGNRFGTHGGASAVQALQKEAGIAVYVVGLLFLSKALQNKRNSNKEYGWQGDFNYMSQV